MKEESKELVKWLRSMADSYSMPIDEFINDIQPFETLKQRYSLIYQAILNEVDTKDFDTIIKHFKHLKDECSTPQHDKDKTKAINQYHIEFIDNLINKLESYKSLMTNISAPPEGIKCKDNIKPEDLKFIFTKLEGKFHKSVTETNFVSTFQEGTLPDNWQRLNWIGKNPELATLFNQLTGIKPIPSIVTKYFRTDKKYTNTSVQRINNEYIIQLVTAALK